VLDVGVVVAAEDGSGTALDGAAISGVDCSNEAGNGEVTVVKETTFAILGNLEVGAFF
jgi:hypothetical protein